MPPTVPDLMAWFDNAITHDIIDTHFLGDLRAHLRHPARPRQVPTWLWPLLRPAAGPVLTHLTNVVTGMLPPHIRAWYRFLQLADRRAQHHRRAADPVRWAMRSSGIATSTTR